mgnify:CR=1 FL=1
MAMQCNKTGLTLEDWKTILDVVNVYDPNDICHVYPEMGTPEFMQSVQGVFRKLLTVVKNHPDCIQNDAEGWAIPKVTLTQEELNTVGEDS